MITGSTHTPSCRGVNPADKLVKNYDGTITPILGVFNTKDSQGGFVRLVDKHIIDGLNGKYITIRYPMKSNEEIQQINYEHVCGRILTIQSSIHPETNIQTIFGRIEPFGPNKGVLIDYIREGKSLVFGYRGVGFHENGELSIHSITTFDFLGDLGENEKEPFQYNIPTNLPTDQTFIVSTPSKKSANDDFWEEVRRFDESSLKHDWEP